MAGFDNNTMYADNVDFTGSTTPVPTVTLDGQLLIGSTATPNIRVATLTAGAGITITNGAGSIMIAATGGGGSLSGLIPDASTAPGTSPVVGDGGGNITVTGAQVAAGVVGTNVIRTDSLAANTMTIEIQRATSAAVSTPADNGVAHFDNTVFTVGAGAFVSLVGGSVPPAQKFDIDVASGTGTDPVVPTAAGVVTITGGQVGPGVVGANAIQTESLAPNSFAIEVQRTDTSTFSDVTKNGIAHFDDAIFTTDVDGFVSLVGGPVPPAQKFDVDASTPPGTDPVVADGSGIVAITGAQVATGTIGANVIRTNSVAANAYRIEIQRSTAVAGTDPTKNGVSHFNSGQFTVDANGFVSVISTTSLTIVTQVFTSNGTYTPTAGMKYCIAEVVGGGGGGGGAAPTGVGQATVGGGGGAGGYAKKTISAATIGGSQAVTIGAGGAGGSAAGGNGSAGGTSSLGAIVSATGALSGGNGTAVATSPVFQNGGQGGVGVSGDINVAGGFGYLGWSTNAINVLVGAGANSFYGAGGIGSVATLGTAGFPGSSYGAGGGGAGNPPNNVTGRVGGAGSAGVVVITEYI